MAAPSNANVPACNQPSSPRPGALPGPEFTGFRPKLRQLAPYAVTAVLCLLFLFSSLNLWDADLKYPLVIPHGDYLFGAMMVKSVAVNGWYLNVSQIGAPHGLEFHDYPQAETLHMVCYYLISRFTKNPALIINLYYLLGYILISLAALYVLRALRLPLLPSMAAALLFAFLPHHYLRAEYHPFLSSYYLVPFMCLALIWVARQEPFLEQTGRHGRLPYTLSRKGAGALCICFLMGCAGVYYAFFGVVLLMCAGCYVFFRKLRWKDLLPALALAAVILSSIALNLTPSILYRMRHGANPAAAARVWTEADSYSMRIGTLLMPIRQHRIASMGGLGRKYFDGEAGIMRVEDTTAPLGLVGGAGFLILLIWVIWGRARHERDELLDPLGALNLSALLLATTGGFAGLIALLLSAQIRVYNRISVYVAFFAFTALVGVLHRAQQRWFAQRSMSFYAATAVIMGAGLWDLTPPPPAIYSAIRAEYDSDRAFIRRIEGAVPPGSMIFQLPYHPFPEWGFTHKMLDYDPFRGFLHSETLRWSYGAMKGRPADQWQQTTARAPVPELVRNLAYAGFQGIYIDRLGYADNAASITADLVASTGAVPLESSDKRFVFFAMTGYAKNLKAQAGAGWEHRHALAVNAPVATSITGGCSPTEGDSNLNWNWCGHDGEIRFENSGTVNRTLHISAELKSGAGEDTTVALTGDLVSAKVRVGATPAPIAYDVVIPPGRRVIKLHCDGKRLAAPNDPRVLVFAVMNFKASEK